MVSKSNTILAISLSIAVGAISSVANADVLTVGGGYDAFEFGGVGTSFSTDFTFDLTSTATLRVTDAYLSGDQFNITINGVDRGNTSTPIPGSDVGGDFDAAFASPDFSHAAYILGPGNYTVTGTTVLSPIIGGGAGGAELVAGGVPEPSTWAMMLIGFVGLGFLANRQIKKSPTALSIA